MSILAERRRARSLIAASPDSDLLVTALRHEPMALTALGRLVERLVARGATPTAATVADIRALRSAAASLEPDVAALTRRCLRRVYTLAFERDEVSRVVAAEAGVDALVLSRDHGLFAVLLSEDASKKTRQAVDRLVAYLDQREARLLAAGPSLLPAYEAAVVASHGARHSRALRVFLDQVREVLHDALALRDAIRSGADPVEASPDRELLHAILDRHEAHPDARAAVVEFARVYAERGRGPSATTVRELLALRREQRSERALAVQRDFYLAALREGLTSWPVVLAAGVDPIDATDDAGLLRETIALAGRDEDRARAALTLLTRASMMQGLTPSQASEPQLETFEMCELEPLAAETRRAYSAWITIFYEIASAGDRRTGTVAVPPFRR